VAAPDEPLLVQQPYDYYAVLDFEATCEQGRRNPAGYQSEVIELPTVLLDGRTMRVVDEFQSYVRPVVNPTLTAFCTELTGIQQSWVDDTCGRW
jgi:3'-5' exoribonuclease 1